MSERGEFEGRKPDTEEEKLLKNIFGGSSADEKELSPEEQETLDRMEAVARRERILRRAGLPPGTEVSDEELARLEIETWGHFKVHVESALSSLNERERRVLDLRFGLKDGKSRTLKETGWEINRSKSTAWRVEQAALRKLRTPSRIEVLKEYLE